jgi:PAS domain S-box-containing protein
MRDAEHPPDLPRSLPAIWLVGLGVIGSATLGAASFLLLDLREQSLEIATDPQLWSNFIVDALPSVTQIILGLLGLFMIGSTALLLPILRAYRRQISFLTASRERNRAIIDNMADGAVQIDGQGRMVAMNTAAQQIFGYRTDEIRGQPVAALFSEPYRSEYQHWPHGVWANGEDATTQTEIRELCGQRKDGKSFPLYLAMSRVAVGGRDVFTAVLRDLTETRRQMEELALARDEALAADRAKSEFLAMMSHEIRTPLNGVLGMLDLLRDTPLSPHQHDFITTAERSGELLLSIINDILDFSKIEAEKLELQDLEIDLRGIVEEVTVMVASEARDKPLEVASFIDQSVPQWLRGDPYRIRQILVNLMGNAVKFTERGEVVVKVEVQRQTDHGWMIGFRVSDTGIGIAPATLATLFSPFTQGDASLTRRFGGTGLGLVIAKRLAGLMGGEIGGESTPGSGSTFWFTLHLGTATRHVEQTLIHLDGKRALVVDDHATNRCILEHHLKRWGISVDCVEDGMQALQLFQQRLAEQRPYDLAVLDMQMPRMDGIELAQRIKGDPKLSATRLIMLSSLGYPGREARRAGIEISLLKPVREGLLRVAVTELMTTAGAATGATPAQPKQATKRFAARLLVAEDNPVNQKVITMMLKRLGIESVLASDGEAVLAALADERFDLILMDVQMPLLSGYDVTRRIRSAELARGRGEHSPIVAMTAAASIQDREDCLASGMDDFVAKPVQLDKLEAALERWLPGQPTTDG